MYTAKAEEQVLIDIIAVVVAAATDIIPAQGICTRTTWPWTSFDCSAYVRTYTWLICR